MEDWRKTQLQETGRCAIVGLTIAEVLYGLRDLGVKPEDAVLRMGGSLEIRKPT